MRRIVIGDLWLPREEGVLEDTPRKAIISNPHGMIDDFTSRVNWYRETPSVLVSKLILLCTPFVQSNIIFCADIQIFQWLLDLFFLLMSPTTNLRI